MFSWSRIQEKLKAMDKTSENKRWDTLIDMMESSGEVPHDGDDDESLPNHQVESPVKDGFIPLSQDESSDDGALGKSSDEEHLESTVSCAFNKENWKKKRKLSERKKLPLLGLEQLMQTSSNTVLHLQDESVQSGVHLIRKENKLLAQKTRNVKDCLRSSVDRRKDVALVSVSREKGELTVNSDCGKEMLTDVADSESEFLVGEPSGDSEQIQSPCEKFLTGGDQTILRNKHMHKKRFCFSAAPSLSEDGLHMENPTAEACSLDDEVEFIASVPAERKYRKRLSYTDDIELIDVLSACNKTNEIETAKELSIIHDDIQFIAECPPHKKVKKDIKAKKSRLSKEDNEVEFVACFPAQKKLKKTMNIVRKYREKLCKGGRIHHRPAFKPKSKATFKGKSNITIHRALRNHSKAETFKLIPVENDTVLVVMRPMSSLMLGCFAFVQVLHGSASVLGHRLKNDKKYRVFSSKSAVLSIYAEEGQVVSEAQHPNLPMGALSDEWVSSHLKDKNAEVVILMASPWNSSFTQYLSQLKLLNKTLLSGGNKVSIPLLGDMILSPKKLPSWRVIEEGPEWEPLLRRLRSDSGTGKGVRIVICGGKGVGKSTLLKYLINGLLSDDMIESAQSKTVVCLDLDPGQPEFSLPGALSVTHITEPLFGPSFTHDLVSGVKCKKQILLGAVSPQNMLNEYLQIVSRLNEAGKDGSYPLIVNTLGWTGNVGTDLIADILRIIKPTHVIQVAGEKASQNFADLLSSEYVNLCSSGIMKQKEKVHYKLSVLPSQVTQHRGKYNHSPKSLRDARLLINFHSLWKAAEQEISGATCSSACKILWPSVALHVIGSKVPQQHILQVFNGSLVALCQVTAEFIEETCPCFPNKLKDSTRSLECLGWGIVRSIDAVERRMHILTSLSQRVLNTEVNVVALPQIQLHPLCYWLFSSDCSPYIQQKQVRPRSEL